MWGTLTLSAISSLSRTCTDEISALPIQRERLESCILMEDRHRSETRGLLSYGTLCRARRGCDVTRNSVHFGRARLGGPRECAGVGVSDPVQFLLRLELVEPLMPVVALPDRRPSPLFSIEARYNVLPTSAFSSMDFWRGCSANLQKPAEQ